MPDCDVELVPQLDEPKKSSDDVELVSVGTYRFSIEAEEARLRLEQIGVQSVLMDETASKTTIGIWAATGGVRVMVREEDAPKAVKILSE